jgi:perosamine synthetase
MKMVDLSVNVKNVDRKELDYDTFVKRWGKKMLALEGGERVIKDLLPRFNTIGVEEIDNVKICMYDGGPLSGYLGGERHGGYWVNRLEREFAGYIGSRHAIACNSATSGLLLAGMAAGIRPGTVVATTPFTMSATAAMPAFLGAALDFSADIRPDDFTWDWGKPFRYAKTVALIVTNLFGHPAMLQYLRGLCNENYKKIYMIEDNAQAPFAMEHGKYAGTVGHMGVFSFNIHKHLQCGEGGIVVTDDDQLADLLRLYRNHGEMAGGQPGLNLRMTEVTAAIAIAQLAKREQIISERIEIAETLSDAVKDIPGLRAPVVREGCKHVYYAWALTVDDSKDFYLGDNRDLFVDRMAAEGFPMRKGYVEPLYHLPAFEKYATPCPVAEQAHRTIALYENCAYTPTAKQLKQVREAFLKVVDKTPALG